MLGNTERVQTLYGAFGRGDVAFILLNLAPSIDWISNCNSEDIPWGGARKGHPGALSFFGSLDANLNFEIFEPLQFAAEGALVFVRGRTVAQVKSTGRKFDSEWVHVFTFADDKVIRFQEFYDTAAIISALSKK